MKGGRQDNPSDFGSILIAALSRIFCQTCMMKRNLRKQLKNTITSAALVCTIIANSISPSFAVDGTPETVAGQEEADNSVSDPALPAGDSSQAVGQVTHVYPDGENVIGEFDKLKKTAAALKDQLGGKNGKVYLPPFHGYRDPLPVQGEDMAGSEGRYTGKTGDRG